MSEVVDEFFTARNLLYLGAYAQSLSTLASLTRLSPDAQVERDSLQYRAYLGQGNHQLVLDELPASTTPPVLQAVRQLAQQHANGQADHSIVLRLAEDPAVASSAVFAAVGAQVLANAGQYSEALRLLAGHPKNLECVCVMVSVYLRINRADLAQKLVERVRAWAEDAPLAQLAEAWVGVVRGGAREAGYVFEELAQAQAAANVRLLGAQAVAKLQMAEYPEARELLEEATERDPRDAETLANRLVLETLAGGAADQRARLLGQLKAASPEHAFVKDLAAKEAEFDRLAAELSK